MKSIKSFRLESLWAIGLVQAAGLVTYVITFVSIFFNLMNGTNLSIPVLAPIIMLTAFVFSALVCTCIALLYPALQLIKGDTKRGVLVIVWTVAWLSLFVAVGVAIAMTQRTPGPPTIID